MDKMKMEPYGNSKESLDYDSAVYWFRDYWSNRLRLNRNISTEDFGIDTKGDFLPGELTIDKASAGKCNVKWTSGQFAGLVEPFKLARQYEPFSIRFPFNKTGIRDELPDPNYRIDSELAKKVMATPLIQTSGEVKLWLSILLRVIIPSILFLIIEAAILSYATTFDPELARFSFIAIAVSIAVFFYFSLVAFVRMGVSEGTAKIIGAKATVYFYDGQHPEKFHYRFPGDAPKWLEAKPYWVFRYVYSWSFELAPSKGFPLFQAVKDIERLDVWLDARSGTIEWIVSDYHWRELWYRAESTLASVNVWVLRNFHTLRPLNISTVGKGTLSDLYLKGQPLSKVWMENLENYKASHSNYFKANNKNKIRIGNRLLFSNLSDLWWEKWRYQYGANDAVYTNPVFPATGEQPSLPASVLQRQKPMTDAVTPTIPSSFKAPAAPLTKVSVIASRTATPTAKSVVAKENITASSKSSHAFLYTGIATAAVLSTLVVGYLYMKAQRKNRGKLEAKAA